MKSVKPSLIGSAALASVAGLLVLAGCGGSGTAQSGASPPSSMGSGRVLANHPFTITINPARGTREHVTDANFAVQPGVPVQITVVNLTRRPHTLTAPELGTSVYIRPATSQAARKTTFTLKANRYGVFRWYCVLPCGHDMSGNVYAIIG